MIHAKARWGCATVLGATLLGTPACSSGNQGGSSAAPVAEAAFPDQGAAALCDGLGTCCRSQGFAFDDAACRSVWRGQLASFAPASTAVVYDANAAGECLSAMRSTLAACSATTVNSDACERIHVGTKPAGATCTGSEECAAPAGGSAYCDDSPSLDGGASPSVCVVDLPLVHGTLDQSCSSTCTVDGSSESCGGSTSSSGVSQPATNVACYTNDGLYCSSTYTCERQSQIGSACSGWLSCVDGAYCDAEGICEAKKADGQACGSSTAYDECIGYCTASAVCASETSSSPANADTCTVSYDL
jgi:hypothetical protein